MKWSERQDLNLRRLGEAERLKAARPFGRSVERRIQIDPPGSANAIR
jgi:hypothetical protein